MHINGGLYIVWLFILCHVLASEQAAAAETSTHHRVRLKSIYHFRQPRSLGDETKPLHLLSQRELFSGLEGVNAAASDSFFVSQHEPVDDNKASDHFNVHQKLQTSIQLDDDPTRVPNITDKETVINLAKMTSNAYVLDPFGPDWLNTSLGFNVSDKFGWEGDGLRGQVFATEDNSTIVVSFKGTSVDPRDPWRNNDRLNDVLLFSCCCGSQNPWGYAPVCDCACGTYECNQTCVIQSVIQKEVYYSAAVEVVQNITALFPDSNFWLVGHSLGGALASLVGMTFDFPAVSFESPPDLLPATRLGLQPSGSRRSTTYHFGNTADPIFVGACNGFFSSCSSFGFSFESQCFAGKRCVYDTVIDKGWRVSITNHRINRVIEDVLKTYDTVPECKPDSECGEDCYLWKYDQQNEQPFFT